MRASPFRVAFSSTGTGARNVWAAWHALCMSDELFDLRLRRGALNLQVEGHLLKRAGRPTQVVLVGNAEGGTNVDLSSSIGTS